MSADRKAHRKVTRVAVGVLLDRDGRVLLADRPAGKPYAGYWEFPGGKIEPDEHVGAALERELHEELGIDAGRSVPWVTFEFDYPHAYVELQFRIVRAWRGEAQAREGQRLGFFDPAGPLPQPLLPAAVPPLRWLLLPRTVVVLGAQGATTLANAPVPEASGERSIVVVDADWQDAEAPSVFGRLRVEWAATRPVLLASGPGAAGVTVGDGVVVAPAAAARLLAPSMRGAWVGSEDELQLASKADCDFALVRSTELATALRTRPTPLPAYLPADGEAGGAVDAEEAPAHGRWIDRRRPAGVGA
jgi:8-oxo-dGTP diphosphatase